MKEFLLNLNKTNKKRYDVFIYIWLRSDNEGKFKFNINDICHELNISRSGILNAIKTKDGATCLSCGNGMFNVDLNISTQKTNIPETSKKQVAKINPEQKDFENSIKQFLISFYERNDFLYTDFHKHFKYGLMIMTKLDILIKQGQLPNSQEDRLNSFKVFFEKLPSWWVENKKLSLTTLNKNFNNIINDIKSNRNESYSNLRQQADTIDFSEFTNS